MLCPTCGHELGTDQLCSFCGAVAPSISPQTSPAGDVFLAARPPTLRERAKPAILVIAGLLLWLLILGLNYLKALRWAGVMNPRARGYMMGGCFMSLLLGLLAMFVVAKIRGRKSPPVTRFFGVSAVGFFFSFLSFVGSLNAPPGKAYQDAGELLRQAAGSKPATTDANWWDGPTRDFYRDILDRNQQYIAELKALDNSAIQDLYSPDSYAGKAHMEKVVSQLTAMYNVETKYSSLEPVLKTLRDRVAATRAPEPQKQEFLKGVEEGLTRSLKPREQLLRGFEVG